MKWPWTRKTDRDEAIKAKRRAEEHLAEARAQWPEVNRVAASLRDLRRRNGFSEQITFILGGGEDK